MPKNFRKRSLEPDAADHSDDEDVRRYPSLAAYKHALLPSPLLR
jgi:hypothetical protein